MYDPTAISSRPDFSYPVNHLEELYPQDKYPEFWGTFGYSDEIEFNDDALREHFYNLYVEQETTADVTDGQVFSPYKDRERTVVRGLKFHNVQIVVIGETEFVDCEFSGENEIYSPPGFEDGCYQIAMFRNCKITGRLHHWCETTDSDVNSYFFDCELQNLVVCDDIGSNATAESVPYDDEEGIEDAMVDSDITFYGGSLVGVFTERGEIVEFDQ